MDAIFNRLTVWLAPVLSFTMEEVWQTRFGDVDGSVHLQVFPVTPGDWNSEELQKMFEIVLACRTLVNEEIENYRGRGDIKSSLEAEVVLIGYTSD